MPNQQNQPSGQQPNQQRPNQPGSGGFAKQDQNKQNFNPNFNPDKKQEEGKDEEAE